MSDLDLQFTQARIVDDEGDLLVVLGDGEHEVTLNPGMGGAAGAARGADRVAEVLGRYADLQRIRAGDVLPFQVEESGKVERTLTTKPPINAFG
jgi:hypothetical protein